MPNIITDNDKIKQLLTRGVENIYPDKDFLEKELKSGRQLKLYVGYDPTGPTLHIGHAITMMKMRQFQDLGHKIIMLIGDFTAMIGDPDKKDARKQLTREEVLKNCEKYKEQASAILNFAGNNPVELRYNSEWHSKMTFEDVINLASNFTVQQMLTRDMFERRFYGQIECPYCKRWTSAKNIVEFDNDGIFNFTKGKGEDEVLTCLKCTKEYQAGDAKLRSPSGVYLHEFMYPLMQGYDCVAMDVDGELGGNDQTFNMLAGRTLMKSLKNKEKFVLTLKLLVDPKGTKMGKTEGNMITLVDTPDEMFGKVMSWTDGMITLGYELCTFVPMDEIKNIEQQMKDGANPRDFKIRLAKELVKIYHDEKTADEAEQNFINQFQKHQVPEDITEYPTTQDEINLIDLLTNSKLVTSKSEARRMIEQNAVKIDGETIADIDHIIKTTDGMIIQKGKRGFVKISKS